MLYYPTRSGWRSWLLAILLLCALAGAALAQSGYDLSWRIVAGGGATGLAGGGYELGGTAGQPAAGSLAGGGYTLASGFWTGASTAPRRTVYLPALLKK